MNVEIAQRLAALRREKGYSQEELAEQLGLSRQAVSKWERAESSPDTGNLVALARLYKITIDELLRIDADIDDDVKFEFQDRATSAEARAQEAADRASIAAQQASAAAASAQVSSEQAQRNVPPYYANQVQFPEGAASYGAPSATTQAPTGAAPYGTPGVTTQTPAGAVPYGVPGPSAQPPVGAASYVVPTPVEPYKAKPQKSLWATFPYPIICVIAFLFVGFTLNLWHPGWLIFLTIPFYYWIVHVIDNDPNNQR